MRKVREIFVVAGLLSFLAALFFVAPANAQSGDKGDGQQSESEGVEEAGSQDLQREISEMQIKIAKLKAALKQQHGGQVADGEGVSSRKRGMSGMKKMQGMKGMDGNKKMGMKKMQEMKKMAGKNREQGMRKMQVMKKMGDAKAGTGMKMMGKVKSMGQMSSSSLPGFPGASHIYHVGADGFFLDHSEHIELTNEQSLTLNEIKEETMLQQADFEREIEAAEQEIWVLTSSGSPDVKKIEEKIAEVSKLQSEQRISYIRAIGKAAQTLTAEQRQALTGTAD